MARHPGEVPVGRELVRLPRPMTGYRAQEPMAPQQVEHRFALWCSLLDVDPARLLDLVEDVQVHERDRVARLGARGDEPHATFLARGDVEQIDAERAWLREQRARLVAAAERGHPS